MKVKFFSRICLGLLPLVAVVSPALALQMQPLYEIQSDQQQLVVEIMNDGKQAQAYSLNLQAINSPYDKKGITTDKPILLVQPQKLQLAAGQQGRFRLVYQGGAESQERYFRLTVDELAPVVKPAAAEKPQALANYGVSSSTLVLLRPRELKFAYGWQDNQLRNTGNAAFWVMHDEDCGRKQGRTYLLEPGKDIRPSGLQRDTVLRIGLQDEILTVQDSCKAGR